MSDTVLSATAILIYLILTTALRKRNNYYLHFTDEEAEVQGHMSRK